MMKTCTCCQQTKPLAEFYVRRKDGVETGHYPACRACQSEKRTRERKTPEGRVKYNAWSRVNQLRAKLRRWGLSDEQIAEVMVERESGACHACGRRPSELSIPNPSARVLHADHDHASERYRGLLCQPCNSTLGLVDDSPVRLLQLVDYLIRTRQDLEVSR